MSQTKKWLNEPKALSFYVQFEAAAGFCFFKFNSVGLNDLPGAKSCFVWLLLISYTITILKNGIKVVNTARLENIVIKTKNLEYLEQKSKGSNKNSRRALTPKGKK